MRWDFTWCSSYPQRSSWGAPTVSDELYSCSDEPAWVEVWIRVRGMWIGSRDWPDDISLGWVSRWLPKLVWWNRVGQKVGVGLNKPWQCFYIMDTTPVSKLLLCFQNDYQFLTLIPGDECSVSHGGFLHRLHTCVPYFQMESVAHYAPSSCQPTHTLLSPVIWFFHCSVWSLGSGPAKPQLKPSLAHHFDVICVGV